MTIILLLVGLGLLILGADRLIKGASDIATVLARKSGASEFIIGFTIVGFGTSCPELVVSLTGAIQGNADIAIGNVVGSNIFNTLFILGITALIFPVSMTATNRRRDIPIAFVVSILLIISYISSSDSYQVQTSSQMSKASIYDLSTSIISSGTCGGCAEDEFGELKPHDCKERENS